jgi:hypothetical protein
MAAASDVTFDVLLGGKVTPQLLKSFKDLEALMQKQGATELGADEWIFDLKTDMMNTYGPAHSIARTC